MCAGEGGKCVLGGERVVQERRGVERYLNGSERKEGRSGFEGGEISKGREVES